MKALFLSIGSRGDMEPFLALAVLFRKRGWEVHCGMPAQFESLASDQNLPFTPFDPRFIDLIDGKEGRDIMGQKGSIPKRLLTYIKLARKSFSLQGPMIREQRDLILNEKPDLVIYHGKCIYPVIWGMQNHGKTIMMSAMPCIMHPVAAYPNVGMPLFGGPGWNLWTYKLYNSIFATITRKMCKYLPKAEVDKKQLTKRSIKDFLLNKQPYYYSISPAVFPRPTSWPDHVKLTGFRDLPKAQAYTPPPELEVFLKEHQKVLFISFGSMVNNNPKAKTEAIISLLAKHKIPAILNTSWGGLNENVSHPEHVLFVQNIPYDWLFPKVYAVMHHGGSGTTHTGLKNGCATMVIPHIVDQFFWNRLIAKIGAGPMGMPIKKLNALRLEEKLLDLWMNRDYKLKAEQLARQMAKEDFEEKILNGL